jgi:hypothetical protein
MKQRGLAASTIDRRLSTVCGFSRFAYIDGRITSNPAHTSAARKSIRAKAAVSTVTEGAPEQREDDAAVGVVAFTLSDTDPSTRLRPHRHSGDARRGRVSPPRPAGGLLVETYDDATRRQEV